MYVLPTYHEGMPMSILEAMSYGMAVISTYVGGIPHMITDGENGLLCQAGDEAGLREALMRLLASKEERRRLGCNAGRTVRDVFDVRKMVNKVTELYGEVMAETGGKA